MLVDRASVKLSCKWVTQKDPSDMTELELADEAYAAFQVLNNYFKCMNHGDISFETQEYVNTKIMDIIYLLPEMEESQNIAELLYDIGKMYPSFSKYEEMDQWSFLINDIKNSFADLFLKITNN